jgi:response regulator NasT
MAATTDTPRIVIAADAAIIRLDLKEMLQEEGFDVVGEASDGDAAIRLAEERRSDLVIMDIKMPGMDGLAAAERITDRGLGAVLILTAFSQKELVRRAAQAGAMGYLVKPFQKSDLVPAIEIALVRHAELEAVKAESADLAERLDARKFIDRAKGYLADKRGMSEAEAFRFIQKKAMDERRSMKDVARDLVGG